MIYRERTEVVITLNEDQDPDEALPLIEAAGIENCEVNRALRMIIGYITTMDIADRKGVFQQLYDIPSVQDVSSAIIHNVIREE